MKARILHVIGCLPFPRLAHEIRDSNRRTAKTKVFHLLQLLSAITKLCNDIVIDRGCLPLSEYVRQELEQNMAVAAKFEMLYDYQTK